MRLCKLRFYYEPFRVQEDFCPVTYANNGQAAWIKATFPAMSAA